VEALPDPPPAPAPAAAPQPEFHAFSFTGRAADYFRIWIVNLLLTLVTLGLWSPWAKVRKRRYFYGHTWVAGANFEYHGDPVVILRGRLIAAAAFAAYWVLENLRPGSGPWLLFALVAGAPWIIARSLQFNAANSSHRGIRFRFDGRAGEVALAVWPLGLWPVALLLAGNDPEAMSIRPVAFVIGIVATYVVLMAAYPYAMARVRRLTVARSSWGSVPFASALRTGKVYGIYGIAFLLGLAAAMIVGILVAIWIPLMGLAAKPGAHVPGIVAGIAVPFLIFSLYAVVVAGLMSYTRSRIGNLVFNTASLGRLLRFRSSVSARKLARMYLANLVLILLSAGLLIPWAVVRVARYRVGALRAEAAGSLAQVTAAVRQRAGATGDELGEMFGFDLAL
jgi:uncharacterized membrane protein YjgN (DUF898 family)